MYPISKPGKRKYIQPYQEASELFPEVDPD
jgi:hypothetical protein